MIEIRDLPKISKPIYEMINARFEAQNINPVPLNYLVWYHYFRETNTDLVAEMDQLITSKSYNDRAAKRLYQTYLEGAEIDAQDQFDTALRAFVNDMVNELHQYGNNLGAESSTMASYANELSNPGMSTDQFKDVAAKIIRQATQLQSSTLQMSKSVQDNANEIESLRKQLEEARSEALTDELTTVGNRKAFNKTLETLTTVYQDKPENLCLIIADIDYFKKFNDTYGHLVGDSVLRYFGRLMKQTTNDNEHICRYGGEEFGIVIKETSLEKATQRAESIRKALEKAVLSLKESNERINKITASFGVTRFNGKNESIESFISRADENLYQAKKTGRNKVIAA